MALTPEQQRELNQLERERLDLALRGDSLEENKLERLKELRRLDDEELSNKQKSIEYQIEELDLINEKIKKANILKDQSVEVTGIYREQLNQAETLLDIRERQLDLTTTEGKEELAKIARAREELKVKRQGYNDAEGFAKRFMGITKEPNTEIGKFLVDPASRFEGIGAGLGDVINATSIMTSTVDKVVEASVALAIEQDQAVVNFRRATSATGEFDNNIRVLERSLFTSGVTTAEASQAVQSLFLNVSDFTEMSENQQKTLAETTAILNELGVAADTTANNFEFATRALGMNTTEAARLQRQLLTFAQDLGVSGDKIARDFERFGANIAALGDKGVDAFLRLEMQAKATGLAIEDIVSLTDQFNKFDSAAQAVGKLNAVLGGPFLNTLQLVNETDPSKRMEMLARGIQRAGKSFDQMEFFERKMLATAIGVNEEQLALMMRGEFNVGPPPKTAQELEELRKQTAQFNTVMEEMRQVAMALAISFGPLVSMLKTTMQFLSPMLEAMTKYPGLAFGMVAGISALLRGFSLMSLSINEMTKAERRSLILFAAMGTISLMAQLVELGHGMEALAVGIGAVTFAIIALKRAEQASVILGALGLVTMGISALVHSMTVGNSPSLVEAFMMVAAAIPFMTLAMLGLMPLLPALLLAVPPLVFAFVMLSDALSEMLSDNFVNNLQLMAVEVANIVASINELSATKAVAFTTSMAATTVAATANTLTGGAVSAVAGAVGGAESPAAPATAAAPAGPPPVININLSIDGKEFATVVNSVEVSKYGGGSRSSMYDSIVGMIEQGLVKG